jgi:hypothetical protein
MSTKIEGQGTWHTWEKCVEFLLGDLDVDSVEILKSILKKQDIRMWTGFTWLRIVTVMNLQLPENVWNFFIP